MNMIAVIPVLVWVIVSFLAGAGAVAGWGIAVKWDDFKKQTSIPEIERELDGVVSTFPDPMVCVDEYYKAVCSGNHRQYQYCVMEPLDKQTFGKKVGTRKESMEKQGIDFVKEPVRGRSKIVEKKGVKASAVTAVSPWTGKEEEYHVVEHGQSWRIVEEK